MLELDFFSILIHYLNIIILIGIGVGIVFGLLYLVRRFGKHRTDSGR